MGRAASDPGFHWHSLHRYSYLHKGHYAEQLARWLRHYDGDRLLVLTTDE